MEVNENIMESSAIALAMMKMMWRHELCKAFMYFAVLMDGILKGKK